MNMRCVDQIYSIGVAPAAVLKDGMVVTWDDQDADGDCSNVKALLGGVVQTYSICKAFAAVLKDWNVVTWGEKDAGVYCEGGIKWS